MKIKDFIKKWMLGYEPNTFIPNKYGQYIYYSKNGASGLNLVAFFEDLLNEYIESQEDPTDDIIKSLSGEEIKDIPTFTSTTYPVEEQKASKGMTAEEILTEELSQNYMDIINKQDEEGHTTFKDWIIEAMDRYASQAKPTEGMREEIKRIRANAVKEQKDWNFPNERYIEISGIISTCDYLLHYLKEKDNSDQIIKSAMEFNE